MNGGVYFFNKTIFKNNQWKHYVSKYSVKNKQSNK
jgi:hypothetical protein